MRTKVPVWSRDSSSCAALAAADRRSRERLHSLWRLKLSATRWWPASILRGNCAFDWLNERQFPSLHCWSFVAVVAPLSSSPKAVFQPSALTDTGGLRGSQVNYVMLLCVGGGAAFHLAHACWSHVPRMKAQVSHQLSCAGIKTVVCVQIGVWRFHSLRVTVKPPCLPGN